MKNRYKIDCHFEWDRLDRPFGVFVHTGLIFRRWKFIVAFKTDAEAQAYIAQLTGLPREIYKAA